MNALLEALTKLAISYGMAAAIVGLICVGAIVLKRLSERTPARKTNEEVDQ